MVAVWKKSATGYLAGGLEDGADTGVLAKRIRQLMSRGQNMDVQLLICIGAGGMWPNDRVVECCSPTSSPYCPMCDKNCRDTVWDRAYECPYIIKEMAKVPRLHYTRYLCRLARSERGAPRQRPSLEQGYGAQAMA